MNDTARKVFARLREMKIDVESCEHAAVETIADCTEIDARLHALTVKNYFLGTRNQKHFYLCLVRPDARFRAADISRQVGSARLSFAGEADMRRLLHVYPGAVSPMGLMFDTGAEAGILVDTALRTQARLAFHPCDNTMTLSMSNADFFGRFLPQTGHTPIWIEVHDFVI